MNGLEYVVASFSIAFPPLMMFIQDRLDTAREAREQSSQVVITAPTMRPTPKETPHPAIIARDLQKEYLRVQTEYMRTLDHIQQSDHKEKSRLMGILRNYEAALVDIRAQALPLEIPLPQIHEYTLILREQEGLLRQSGKMLRSIPEIQREQFELGSRVPSLSKRMRERELEIELAKRKAEIRELKR